MGSWRTLIVEISAVSQRSREFQRAKFEKQLQLKRGGEFQLVGEYRSAKEKVAIQHACGRVLQLRPTDILYKKEYRCICSRPPRSYNTNSLSEEEWQRRLEACKGGRYTALEPYGGYGTKILIRCNNCGFSWKVTPINLLRDHGTECLVCGGGGLKRFTREIDSSGEHIRKSRPTNLVEFSTRVLDATNGEYVVVSDSYTNCKTKVIFRHEVPSCGREFPMTPNNFINLKQRCPMCARERRESANVAKIEAWLMSRGIEFQRESLLPGMKLVLPLRLDFWISDRKIAIEYDGPQHFSKWSWINCAGVEGLDVIQARDRAKDNYCIENGILLLRVRASKELNIERTLEEFFQEVDEYEHEFGTSIEGREGRVVVA